MKQGRDGETKSHRLAKERFRLIKYLKGNVPAHAFTKATATSGVSVAYGAECDVVTPTFSPADLQAANAALNAPTTEAASPMTSSASNITPPYPAAFMAFVELTVVAACKFVAVNCPAALPPPTRERGTGRKKEKERLRDWEIGKEGETNTPRLAKESFRLIKYLMISKRFLLMVGSTMDESLSEDIRRSLWPTASWLPWHVKCGNIGKAFI